MSREKFAPITSSLLARKGDAKPWQPPSYEPRKFIFSSERQTDIGLHADCEGKSSPEPRDHPHNAAASRIESVPNPDPSAERTKRISLPLSPAEFERLGIAAVKRGVSRRQIMRESIEFYLTNIAHTLNAPCGCLSEESCQRNCPTGPAVQGN